MWIQAGNVKLKNSRFIQIDSWLEIEFKGDLKENVQMAHLYHQHRWITLLPLLREPRLPWTTLISCFPLLKRLPYGIYFQETSNLFVKQWWRAIRLSSQLCFPRYPGTTVATRILEIRHSLQNSFYDMPRGILNSTEANSEIQDKIQTCPRTCGEVSGITCHRFIQLYQIF